MKPDAFLFTCKDFVGWSGNIVSSGHGTFPFAVGFPITKGKTLFYNLRVTEKETNYRYVKGNWFEFDFTIATRHNLVRPTVRRKGSPLDYTLFASGWSLEEVLSRLRSER